MNLSAQLALLLLITILILVVDNDHERIKRHIQDNQCPSSCTNPKCLDTGDTP